MKKKLLLTSILSIVMCFSLICGATFALFTSESKVNIAVTSGTVSISATATNTAKGSTLGTENASFNVKDNKDGTFELTGMVPHDYAEFTIVAENNSDVDIQYRVATALSGELASALKVEITRDEATLSSTGYTDWANVTAGTKDLGTYNVKITFESQDDPETTDVNEDNFYHGKQANLAFNFEAVQGNAPVINPIEKVGDREYNVNNELGMQVLGAFAKTVGASEGKEVTFNIMKDMDMSGYDFNLQTMWLIVNGNGHTVSNVTTKGWRAGFFGYGGACKLNNIVLENFNLTGAQAGIIAGSAEGTKASNVTIKGNNSVTFAPYATEAYTETWNGIGAIFGVTVDSSVENVTIDSKAVININYGAMETADGCVYCDDTAGGTFINNYSGQVTVEDGAQIIKSGNVYYPIADGFAKDENGNYVILSEAGLQYFAKTVNEDQQTYENKTVLLANDIDLANTGYDKVIGTSEENAFMGTFDGNGKTISNLTLTGTDGVGLFGCVNEGTIKNLTVKNAKITGVSNVGTIVGLGDEAIFTMENCKVEGLINVEGNYKVGGLIGGGAVKISNCMVEGEESSYVKATYLKTDLEGDNAGGLIGMATDDSESISNCSVKGVDVAGSRKVGGLVGCVSVGTTVSDITVENVSVSTNAPDDYKQDNADKILVGGVIGECLGDITISNTTKVSNVTVTGYDADTTGAVVGGTRNDSATITVEAQTENVTVTPTNSTNA